MAAAVLTEPRVTDDDTALSTGCLLARIKHAHCLQALAEVSEHHLCTHLCIMCALLGRGGRLQHESGNGCREPDPTAGKPQHDTTDGRLNATCYCTAQAESWGRSHEWMARQLQAIVQHSVEKAGQLSCCLASGHGRVWTACLRSQYGTLACIQAWQDGVVVNGQKYQRDGFAKEGTFNTTHLTRTSTIASIDVVATSDLLEGTV